MKTIRIGVWMVCVMLAGAVWAAQPPNPNAEGKKPVGEAPPRSLRTYHFGCSTTDCVTYWADPSGIAKSLGKTHEWSRFTIPGAGVEAAWAHGAKDKVGELGASSWDGVVVACYPNGNPLTIENDLKFMGYLYEAALKKNPNCILYVSSVWPFNADGLKFEQQWNSTTTQYHAGYASRKFHEDLIKAAQAKYGASRARLLPFGHAMAKLNDWIKSGKTTRLTNIFQLYKDYIHLTDEGSYLLAMVQYAVLFKSDPHGATRTFQAGDHAVTVDEAFAKLAWDVAWETVNELSEFTGVGNANATDKVAEPARTVEPGKVDKPAKSEKAVSPSTLRAEDQPATAPLKLEIVKAVYGDFKNNKTADVTEKVKSMVTPEGLTLKANDDIFGDPAAGVYPKQFRIEYTLDGKPSEKVMNQLSRI